MKYFELGRQAQYKKEYQKAFEYYTLGSNEDPCSLFGLGLCYKYGYYLKKNNIKAEEIFEKALPKLLMKASVSDKNVSLALYYVYANGYGCNKDMNKAMMFLEISVEAGSIEAAFISAGYDGGLAYASTNELVMALKDEKDLEKLRKIYNQLDKFDTESPLKYALDAVILDIEFRQTVVNKEKPQEEKDPALVELETIQNEMLESAGEGELNMDWDTAFSTKGIMEDNYAETASDGLVYSLKTLGYVDLEYIARSTSLTIREVISRLKGSIYQDPNKWDECFYKGWVTADEYLSGNLINKLKIAEEANEKYNGYFSENIEAIKRILPHP